MAWWQVVTVSGVAAIMFAVWLLGWFHAHDWRPIARTYVPPFSPTRENPAEYVSPSRGIELNRYWNECLTGKTTILFDCRNPRCSKTKMVEMNGPLVNDTVVGMPAPEPPKPAAPASPRWKA